jgi:hypothetical protein
MSKSKSSAKSQSMTGEFQISQSLTGKLASAAQTPSRPFTLSWTHYVFLLGIKHLDERRFYEIEAFSLGWAISRPLRMATTKSAPTRKGN